MKKQFSSFLIGLMVVASVGGYTYAQSSKQANVIPFPTEYDTMASGASSYDGIANVSNSMYFTVIDFYNMKSTKDMTVLPNYKTYQQTTEVTCGPASALTVLHHFGETKYKELEIAEIMGTHKDRNFSNLGDVGVADERGEFGTSTSQMVHFFNEIGWAVETSITMADESGYTFEGPEDFKEFVIQKLKDNTPIMVENIDWGGHWRVIIGDDTMGTPENNSDDVIIMADPYDTSDHMQDGYTYANAERFFYMWYDSHILPETQKYQQWLTAKPKKDK